jgi:hypothetical protein
VLPHGEGGIGPFLLCGQALFIKPPDVDGCEWAIDGVKQRVASPQASRSLESLHGECGVVVLERLPALSPQHLALGDVQLIGRQTDGVTVGARHDPLRPEQSAQPANLDT